MHRALTASKTTYKNSRNEWIPTKPYAFWTIPWQTNSQSIKLQTSQLADSTIFNDKNGKRLPTKMETFAL